MTAAWIVATPNSRDAYDTEQQAEKEANEVIKSKRATVAVVYRAEVEG